MVTKRVGLVHTEHHDHYRHLMKYKDHRCRDRMIVGFTTTCAYYRSWRGILDTTLCDHVCQ